MKHLTEFYFRAILFVFLIISLNSYGQSNSYRAYYLPNINVWLGNTIEENKRLDYAANNGFNYIIFYDLHLLNFTNAQQMNLLASFLSRAKNNYGIAQTGACAETYTFFLNKILPYNNSRSNQSEKFNVLNYEFEFWVQSSITQYYCSSYLQPGGYNCDTAGAFAYSIKQFKKIDSLCAANGLISELYIGWPNKGQMQKIVDVCDRILIHAYTTTDATLYSYSRNRLIDAASLNRPVNILPIFSSESSFLGPWLQTHPIYQPYQTYSANYISETGTWKQFINLQGYTWFYYPTMPQTTSGTAAITAGGPTTLCLGDSVQLTASAGASYLWYPGGQTTQSIWVKQTGNYLVNVIGANGASVTSTPLTVTVGTNQVPVTVTASGPVSFCAGDSVILTCTSAGSYLWSNGATTSSITIKNSGSYSVNIPTGNCTASSTPVIVNVSPIPAVPQITTGDTAICPGSSVTLTTSSSGNLVWSTGETTQSIVVNAAGSYWVRIYNSPACYSQSGSTAVSILPSPPLPVVSANGPTTICSGDSVILTSTPANSYLWSTGETTQSITVKQAGNYSVTVTTGACNIVLTSLSTTINVTTASPQIVLSSDTFCTGDSVQLSCSIAADSYLWSTGAVSSSIYVSQQGSISLTIETGGCSFASDMAEVYETNTIPNPVIAVNGPTSLCPGQSATLVSSQAGTYLWSNGSTTPSITISQPGIYSVSVQSGTCSAISDPVIIGVNNTPVNAVVTAGGPLTFCAGGSVTLTSSTADSYLWSNGATTSSIVVTQSGNYSVTVQTGGCTGISATTNVTVDGPLSVPVITASGPLTFCSGGSVTLTASAAPNYLWSNGATASSITVNQTGVFSVTTSQGTCSNVSATKSITVNPIPPKPVITTNRSTSLCSGQSVTLTSSATSSNIWSTGATSVSITVSAAGNYTVTTTSAGCSSTSDPKNVTVTATPARPTITASGSRSICPGSAVTLTSSSLSNNVWSNGATTRSVVATTAGSYWVKVVQNGCSSSQSSTSLVSVLSAPSKPTISVTSGSLTLQNTSSSVTLRSSQASRYLWSNNSTSRSITLNAPGVYRVTVFNSNNCPATSNDVRVTSTACTPPTAPVITLSGPNILQPGQSVTLTSTAAPSYLWSTGATTQSITVSSAGTYTVKAYNTGSCFSTSLPVNIYAILSRQAAEVYSEEDVFRAYPNPAREKITFSLYSDTEKECILRLIDMNGSEVEMISLHPVIGLNTTEMNLSGYQKGFYVACLVMDDKTRFLKIIVE